MQSDTDNAAVLGNLGIVSVAPIGSSSRASPEELKACLGGPCRVTTLVGMVGIDNPPASH